MQNEIQAGKPLSNLMYDWVSILHAKAKGLDAYEKYFADARAEESEVCIELLTRLRDMDTQMVQEVRDHLAEMFENEEMTDEDEVSMQDQDDTMQSQGNSMQAKQQDAAGQSASAGI